MITARAQAVAELEKRLLNITKTLGHPFDIACVQRNPKVPATLFPAVNIFEDEDVLDLQFVGGDFRGSTTRKLSIILEFWREPAAEYSISSDLLTFYKSIRYVLFNDGDTLGGACIQLEESKLSGIMRTMTGKDIVGMGLLLSLMYRDSRNYSLS